MNLNNCKDQLYNKESIIKLADEVKIQMNHNKYLLEIIDIFNQQISDVKNIITNYSLNIHQNQNNIPNINPAENYKNILSILNSKLKEEINKNIKKQENLIKKIETDLSMENQTLSQLSIDNFILSNTIRKNDSRIITLSEAFESSKKYDLFREPKRESEIEIKESKNMILLQNLEYQQKFIQYAKSYGNYKYKIIKKKKIINKLKKFVSILKKIIGYYSYKLYGDETKGLNLMNLEDESNKKKDKDKGKKNDKNKKVDIKKRIGTTPKAKMQFETKDNKNKQFYIDNKDNLINEKKEENDNKIINEDEKNHVELSLNKTSFLFDNDSSIFKNSFNNEKEEEKEKNKIINKGNKERKKINILNIDELLDIENIEIKDEELIDEELNSDDEVYFDKKIKPKKRIKADFLQNLKKTVPSISLSQIEFNKLKVINDADAYSLQKRRFEQKNINGKIKNLKKQIKNLEKKTEINKKKLDAIHDFIEDVKYNYKLLRPIKVQTSAAGNPVYYIREKLLNIVEETITYSEKKENKENKENNLSPKEKISNKEGDNNQNEEELVGSDYSDEDEIIHNNENKENININNINNNITNFNDHQKLIDVNKTKQTKNKIRKNLLSKFDSNEKEDNKNNKYNDLYNNNKILLKNTFAQSK